MQCVPVQLNPEQRGKDKASSFQSTKLKVLLRSPLSSIPESLVFGMPTFLAPVEADDSFKQAKFLSELLDSNLEALIVQHQEEASNNPSGSSGLVSLKRHYVVMGQSDVDDSSHLLDSKSSYLLMKVRLFTAFDIFAMDLAAVILILKSI